MAPVSPPRSTMSSGGKYRWQDFITPIRITVWTWKICGLYNERPQSALYRVYRYTFIFTLMVVYLVALMLNMFVMQTFEQLVLYIMYIVCTEIVMVLKGLIAYYNFDRIYALYRRTIVDAFQPTDEPERKLHQEGIATIKYYSYLYFASANVAVASCLLYLLHKDYRMPYFPWMFGIVYGSDAKLSYGLIFAYQATGMYFHMLVNVAGDTQLCYLLGMIGVQLDLLAERFRSLASSEEFEQAFVELVRQYETVHRTVRDVEKLYSPAFFAQFIASGLVICATAFRASSMYNLYELPAIQNLLYMLAMMFQMFLPCRFGNEVTRKSNELKTALYSSQWYDMRQKDRKTLQMLLQRMNKPFTLKGYYFFSYNLQAYTTTLNIAYSVYALLQRKALKGV